MTDSLAVPEHSESPPPESSESSPSLELADPIVLDDVPDVYATFIHIKSTDTWVALYSSRAKRLSSMCKREYSCTFTDMSKHLVDLPDSFSKRTVNLLGVDYSLLRMPAAHDYECLFLVDAADPNVLSIDMEALRDTPAEMVLPFFDSSLCYFLSRTSLFGEEFSKVRQAPDKAHSRLRPGAFDSPRKSLKPRSRRVSMREPYSLEEVFRTLDISGSGALSVDDFYTALQSMGTVKHLTATDVAKVFGVIYRESLKAKGVLLRSPRSSPSARCDDMKSDADGGDDVDAEDDFEDESEQPMPADFKINYAMFFQFFYTIKSVSTPLGALNESSSALPMFSAEKKSGSLSPSFLQVVGEENDEDDSRETTATSEKWRALGYSPDEVEKIIEVKKSITDCLNLGKDYGALTGAARHRMVLLASSSGGKKKKVGSALKCSMTITIGEIEVDTSSFDVSKVIDKLHKVEQLIPLMQSNVFNCSEDALFQKWNNRFLSHKERLANLTTILNKVMHMQVQSLRMAQTDLKDQMVRLKKEHSKEMSALRRGARGSKQVPSLDEAMDLFEVTAPPKRRPRSAHRTSHIAAGRSSQSHRRGSSARGMSFAAIGGADDDDTASIDSEVGYVYTEELGNVSARMKEYRHEAKRLKLELQETQSELRVSSARYEAQIKKLTIKAEKLEMDKKDMDERNRKVKERMKRMGKVGSGKRGLSAGDSAEVQRATMQMRREVRELTKELDKTREANSNLSTRLKRALAAAKKGDGGKGGGDSITKRRIEKFRKELEKREAEVKLKQQKLDEMFLKLKEMENTLKAFEKKQKKLKGKLAEAQTERSSAVLAARKAQDSATDLEAANLELEKLRAKVTKQSSLITKWKVKNSKLKDRIDLLLQELEALSTVQSELDAARAEVNALEAHKRKLRVDLEKAGGKAKGIERELAALNSKIAAKKTSLDKAIAQLSVFKQKVSDEEKAVRALQLSLLERDSSIRDKDEEMAVRMARLEGMLTKKDAALSKYKAQLCAAQTESAMLSEKLKLLEVSSDSKEDEIEELRSELDSKQLALEQAVSRQQQAVAAANEAVVSELQDDVAERDSQIVVLENEMKEMEEKHESVDFKLAKKCAEFEELIAKWEAMRVDKEVADDRVSRLKAKVSKLECESLAMDDEKQMKLRQYDIQVTTIEKNAGRIGELESQLTSLQTDFELKCEECSTLSKTKASLLQQNGDLEEEVSAKKKRIVELKRKLGLSGFGDVKKGSELSLLRKNVIDLESIRSDLEWEVKKLKRKLALFEGGHSAAGDLSSMRSPKDERLFKELNKELNKLKKAHSKLKRKFQDLDVSCEELKSKASALEQLMKSKNTQITKLKGEVRAAEDMRETLQVEARKQTESQRRVSKSLIARDTELATVGDRLSAAETRLRKIPEYQKKISALEAKVKEQEEDIQEILLIQED